jgi:hypothetical protein
MLSPILLIIVKIYNPEQEDKGDNNIVDICDPSVAFKIPNPTGDIPNG